MCADYVKKLLIPMITELLSSENSSGNISPIPDDSSGSGSGTKLKRTGSTDSYPNNHSSKKSLTGISISTDDGEFFFQIIFHYF